MEGPPLTEAMVTTAERLLGVRLPDAYLQLLRERNGGYIEPLGCPTRRPTSWAADHVSLTSLFGIPVAKGDEIADPDTPGQGLLVTPYMIREWGLPENIVLLDGDGHTWIALDYRRSGPAGPPSVCWLDVEAGDELELAETFDDFLNILRPEAEFDLED